MPLPSGFEWIVILVIALLILGPSRLPDVASAVGKSIREFRKASTEVQESIKVDTSPLPAGPAQVTQANAPAEPVASPPVVAAATTPVATPAPAAPPAAPEPNVLQTSAQPNVLSQTEPAAQPAPADAPKADG